MKMNRYAPMYLWAVEQIGKDSTPGWTLDVDNKTPLLFGRRKDARDHAVLMKGGVVRRVSVEIRREY